MDRVTTGILERIMQLKRSNHVRYEVAGECESREESFSGMGIALIAAIIGIVAILILQFRSFAQPFVVLTAIPFAVTGSILALFISRNTFSFTAFIGLTGLVGIVVNNSIMLVDFTNQLRREGRNVREAVREAAQTRLTPILLTTLTTIGGLFPLSLVIIGGLITSKILVLLIVPARYCLFEKNRKFTPTEQESI
ncbi:MAG: hypothetical protein GF398_18070 [Chitinivibrionales bacterium]|nr:hypothetical protein [Chitinivibrionales bacterium]